MVSNSVLTAALCSFAKEKKSTEPGLTRDEINSELEFGGIEGVKREHLEGTLRDLVAKERIVKVEDKYSLKSLKTPSGVKPERAKGYLKLAVKAVEDAKAAKQAASGEPKKKKSRVAGAELPAEEGAYVHLAGKCLKSGEDFKAYVTELPCELGREHNTQPKDHFISLGSSKQISRVHAVIDYDYSAGHYTIEPKGKNSITVRKVQYSLKDMKGSNKRIQVNSKDPIRIGNMGFYFLRSTFEKPKEAYAELARRVFEALPKDTVLGTRSVCEKIVAGNLYFQANYSSQDSFSKLMNSLQQALRRSAVFIRCGNKQRAEWKLRSSNDTTPPPT